MKKILCTAGILVAALFSFSACQSKLEVNDEVSEPKTYTVSFMAEKAGVGTKTAAVEGDESVSYIWTDEDVQNMKLFTVDAESKLTEVSNPTVEKVSDNMLLISATVDAEGAYTFRAILCDPDSWTGSGTDYASRKPKINPNQSPDGILNFDPNADILVSDDLEVVVTEDGGGNTEASSMLMTFRRKVVVSKMTLKNMVAGEKVKKVIITAKTADKTADKNITGYLNGDSMTGQSNVITLSYDNVEVPASGQFPVYFVSMNQEGVSLTVNVTTDQYTYEKSFADGKYIDLNLGQFTKFNVALLAGTPITDLTGYYLIGSYYGDKWQLMDSEINTGSSNHFYPRFESSVTTAASSVNFSEFSSIANIDKYLWKVEKQGDVYSIQSVDTRKYLSFTGTNNAAQAVDVEDPVPASAKFNITISETTATIESCNVSGRVLKYNSGSPRFAFYTSGQGDIFMIPATYDSRTPVTLSFDGNVTKTTDNYSEFTGQSVTVSPDESEITRAIEWSIDDSAANITTSFNISTGAVVLKGTIGSAIVTASFAGNETYRPASASYTITVSDAGTPETPVLKYTLTPASGTNNSYAKNCDIEIDNITWNLTGNSQMNPWRIGGNSLSGVDRTLYSKTALGFNISSIEITHGAASITVNSMTVIVASDANFNTVVATLTPTFAANSTVTVERPEGKDWSNCYYKIVYNVTVSGSSNKYLEFTNAKFYGTKATD